MEKKARRGPRARQCASAAPHGNLPCGAALVHWPLLDSNRMGAHTAMCAGRVPVLLSILLPLLPLTSATEGVEMFMRLGVCVSFWLPKPDQTIIRRWLRQRPLFISALDVEHRNMMYDTRSVSSRRLPFVHVPRPGKPF